MANPIRGIIAKAANRRTVGSVRTATALISAQYHHANTAIPRTVLGRDRYDDGRVICRNIADPNAAALKIKEASILVGLILASRVLDCSGHQERAE